MEEKSKASPWWIGTVVSAFLSVLCFFQINSYWGDTHNFNGIFGFLGLGILFALLTIWFLYKANKTFTGRGG